MKVKGFTLIELMVAIAIVGILASIGIPKLFGQSAKAKATEVTPAAMTYISLQKAYLIEKQAVGSWKKIGYSAPGQGSTNNLKRTENFEYTDGELTSTIKKNKFSDKLGGEGMVAWTAKNLVGLDNCHLGNLWVIYVSATNEDNIDFKTKTTSQSCVVLTGSNWESADIQISYNPEPSNSDNYSPTPSNDDQDQNNQDENNSNDNNNTVTETETGSGTEPDPEPQPDPDQVVYSACAAANGSSWLNGKKTGWEHQEDKKGCLELRDQLIASKEIVCKNHNEEHCSNYVFVNKDVECRITGNNCN